MSYNSQIHHRRSIRLKNFDYSTNGAYFITICTQNRLNLFGEVVVGADSISAQMRLNHAGKLIESIWQETVSRYKSVQSDIYIVMPNHFHCIVSIANRRIGADMESAPTIPSRSMAANPLSTHFVGADSISAPTVGEVIQSFKRNSTVKYIDGVNAGIYPPFNKRIWQRNYYEHIIWNETDYETKWKYIEENPARWTEDEYYDLPLVPAGPGVFQSN